MAITWWTGGKITGLSTDTKPGLTSAENGYIFVEEDTGKVWVWTGSAWTSPTGSAALIFRSARMSLSVTTATLRYYNGLFNDSPNDGATPSNVANVLGLYPMRSCILGHLAFRVVSKSDTSTGYVQVIKNHDTANPVDTVTYPNATGIYTSTTTWTMGVNDEIIYSLGTNSASGTNTTVFPIRVRYVET